MAAGSAPLNDGALRRLIQLDSQAGGHSSHGLVGVHHGVSDVARRSPRVGSTGPGSASRQPTLKVPLSSGAGAAKSLGLPLALIQHYLFSSTIKSPQ
jgi:hypothetical protein